jgi:hypothetical protein
MAFALAYAIEARSGGPIWRSMMNARKAALRQTPPAKVRPVPLQDEEVIDARDPAERIVSHPDGYYWQALDGRQEIGPFATLAEALADMDSGDAAGWAPGETLAEAESELGVSDWIDPDSGALAEGQAHTHLERE